MADRPAVASSSKLCPGPLVWFDVDENDERGWTPAGILECARCSYLIVTGWFHDQTHAHTPLMRGS